MTKTQRVTVKRGRPWPEGERRKVHVMIRLTESQAAALDDFRGEIKRSAYMLGLLTKQINRRPK